MKKGRTGVGISRQGTKRRAGLQQLSLSCNCAVHVLQHLSVNNNIWNLFSQLHSQTGEEGGGGNQGFDTFEVACGPGTPAKQSWDGAMENTKQTRFP